jgi:hypothetical protein
LTDDFRQEVTGALSSNDEEKPRIVEVLSHLGINASRWYYRPLPESERKQRIRIPITVPAEIANAVVKMAEDNPWYGYKRIAVMCRREEVSVSNRQAYRVMKKNGLLHNRPKAKPAELHQARKLYELLIGRIFIFK